MSDWFDKLLANRRNAGLMADLRCALVASKRQRAWPALHQLGISLHEQPAVLAAALFAVYPHHTDSGDLGLVCRQIATRRGLSHDDLKSPLVRRLLWLLAATRAELPRRVRQIVLLAKAHDVAVNYRCLADDLRYWGEQTKLRWANSFWQAKNERGLVSNELPLSLSKPTLDRRS